MYIFDIVIKQSESGKCVENRLIDKIMLKFRDCTNFCVVANNALTEVFAKRKFSVKKIDADRNLVYKESISG